MLNLHAVIYSLIQGGWLATPSTPPGSAPAVKDFLHSRFQEWYAIHKYHGPSSEIQPVKSVMKPLCAQWLREMFDNLLAHPYIIRNGFSAAGITEWLK